MADIALNGGQIQRILFASQADGMSAGASATGTTDTVNIVFTIIWQIVVKDVRYGRDMQPTRRDIGRHKNVQIAAGELIQNPQALFLRDVTGQQTNTMAICRQMSPDIFATMLGVGENNGAIRLLFFDQRLQ